MYGLCSLIGKSECVYGLSFIASIYPADGRSYIVHRVVPAYWLGAWRTSHVFGWPSFISACRLIDEAFAAPLCMVG